MPTLASASSPSELCNRSLSVLATHDRIAPGALPVSLRKHPVWGHLVTHEGSAYERDCKVADAHRAQVSLPPALLERKKDDLLGLPSPAKYRIIDADEALNSFKYGTNGGTILPLAFVVAFSGEQPAYKVENVSASGKHKLRRKKVCANLRAERAV